MINYSIIIPHYDIPDLLVRCLKSIPDRKDIQVIVVDDCSPKFDTYKDRCVEFTSTKLEIYQTPHKCCGAGAARNIGLNYAKGKWIVFADADDYFEDCFDDILSEYEHSDYDVVYFKANSVDSYTKMPEDRNQQLNAFIDQAVLDSNGIFNLRYLFGEPWCKLVKREIIEQNFIRFEETIIHNDTAYSYQVGYFCNIVGVDNRQLYCVTKRMQSVYNQQSIDRYLARVGVFARKYNYLKQRGVFVLEEWFIFPTIVQFIKKLDVKHTWECMHILHQNGVERKMIIKKTLSYLKQYIYRKIQINIFCPKKGKC